MDASELATSVVTVIAAAIAAYAARATSKTSSRGAVQAAEIASSTAVESARSAAETAAYERAKNIYEGTIDLLQEERQEARGEIADLKTKRREDRDTITALHRQVEGLREEVRACKALCRRLWGREDPASPLDPPPDFTD